MHGRFPGLTHWGHCLVHFRGALGLGCIYGYNFGLVRLRNILTSYGRINNSFGCLYRPTCRAQGTGLSASDITEADYILTGTAILIIYGELREFSLTLMRPL